VGSSGTTRAQSPEMELAHVLFMDIVDYSTLPIEEQVCIINELKQTVSETPEYRAADEQKSLISMHTGDGMALAFFGSPEAPVHCAIEIANGLRDHPRIKLRMGVNSGPVYRVPDIKGEPNVAGGGVNFAQRVMDCGDAGHILLAASIADVLRQHGHWAPMIHELGIAEVKHGEHIDISNLYCDAAGNPAIPMKMLGKIIPAMPSTPLESGQAERQVTHQLAATPPRRSRTIWWIGAAFAFVVLALGVAVWLAVSGRPIQPSSTNEPNVAAMPAPTIQAWPGSNSVHLGEPVIIHWQTSNSTGVTLQYDKEKTLLSPTGSYRVHPSKVGPATVELTAQGQEGETAATLVHFEVVASPVADDRARESTIETAKPTRRAKRR